MWLIAGLGNPGASYAQHRHNAGFMVIDRLAHIYASDSRWQEKYDAQILKTTIAGTQCLLVKPQTFMNLSGAAIQPLLQFYKIPPQQLLVLHDELALALGVCRTKQGGGHAGHNGLRDIDARIGDDYWRIRIGIDHPGDKNRVHDHVLSNFTPEERSVFAHVAEAITEHLPLFFTHSPDAMMSKVSSDLKLANAP
jgi:peptidyl-tRNA hydrolase, PTH1 family